MVLPKFLMPGSPPRSPQVAKPGLLGSYFSAMSSPRTGAPPLSPSLGGMVPRPSTFRPTRRDLVLMFLTLSFSFLMFSPSPTSLPVAIPSPGPLGRGSYRIPLPAWLSSSPSLHSGERPPPASRELTFGESVKFVGPSTSGTYGAVTGLAAEEGDGMAWDGAEEEAEDNEWEAGSTRLRGFAPGWTLMDSVYIYNGSIYVITQERSEWPELVQMISTGLPADNSPGNGEARRPKGDEIIFIHPREAAKLWGNRILRMEGTTFLINDGQFLDHYYHFAGELMLGAWRAYASLDPDITPKGETSLPALRRIWFLHQDMCEWRDGPRFNPFFTNTMFPSISYLYPEDYGDLKNATSAGKFAYVLDRALLTDRSAAFYGLYTEKTSRTAASALHLGSTSRWWWEPLRRAMLRYCGVPEGIINRNLEGTGAVDYERIEEPYKERPDLDELEPLAPPGTYRPVVTYISRQGSRRHLTNASHDELVQELEERAKKLDWELVIVEAERMRKEDQIALAGRTTIILGVHGNGLTHLIWMPATPRSAVIEMFYRGGFARDYQWTAHALGMRHFGVRHDEVVTAPKLPPVVYPDGFHGTEITVVGKVVVDVIQDRLEGRI